MDRPIYSNTNKKKYFVGTNYIRKVNLIAKPDPVCKRYVYIYIIVDISFSDLKT